MLVMKAILSIFATIILTFGLSGCGIFQDRYRYECQDPQKWNNEICKPPLCEGYCPADLLGFDPNEGIEEISEETPQPHKHPHG
jgi:hypothetical protein